MRVHTKGECCTLCKKMFLTLKALERHMLLHKQRTVSECDLCNATFSTASSLVIHVRGKHGSGYICDQCQKRFDSPAQRRRYKMWWEMK